jgi:hypothetical protein
VGNKKKTFNKFWETKKNCLKNGGKKLFKKFAGKKIY